MYKNMIDNKRNKKKVEDMDLLYYTTLLSKGLYGLKGYLENNRLKETQLLSAESIFQQKRLMRTFFVFLMNHKLTLVKEQM